MYRFLLTAWLITLAPLPLCNAIVTEARETMEISKVLMRRAWSPNTVANTQHGSHSSNDMERGGSGHSSVAQSKLVEEDAKLAPLVIETAPFRDEVLASASEKGREQHHQASKIGAVKKIQWAQHPEKCLCKNSTSHSALGLVIWDCDDEVKSELMKWIMPPTSALGIGLIRWGGNLGADQCISSFQGWSGNGNLISMNSCSDSAVSSTGALNWSLFNPAGSLNAIAFTGDTTKCLDVRLDAHDHVANGAMLEIWDCSSGTKWILLDP